MSELEDLWSCLDELFAGLSDAEWSTKHGKDWTIADVPFHNAYFDREMVAIPIERGMDLSPQDRRAFKTMSELDAWNAEEFAKRPPDQTIERSLGDLRASWQRIRDAVSGLDDADLGRPVWIPLAGLGQRDIRGALIGGIAHSWSEYMQLPIRLKRAVRLPQEATTHRALDAFMHFFPMALNPAAVKDRPFTLRFTFEGLGGGSWTLRAADGACSVEEASTVPADVEMRMKVQTFPKLWNRMQHPVVMMLTRQVRARGLRNMPRFQRVFPEPRPDQEIDGSMVQF